VGPDRKLTGILLAEHFGDIVACEPVIPWLRREHASDYLVWLTKSAYTDLLRQHPSLDAVLEVDSISVCGEVVNAGVLDRVVDLHLQDKPCTLFDRPHKKITGNPEIDAKNYYKHGSLLEAMTLGAGLPAIRAQPNLFIPPEVAADVDRLKLPVKFAVIHARSNETTRDWDGARWNEIAGKLVAEAGLSLVEVGLRPVLAPRHGVSNLCGQLSLIQTAEVVKRATYYFGVDSGPAHVANAFEIPSVILLGRYRDFDRYMPYTGFLSNHADSMIIHWEGPASQITTAEVLRRFEAIRNWAPATRARGTNQKSPVTGN
jgi:heptosyltransferase III